MALKKQTQLLKIGQLLESMWTKPVNSDDVEKAILAKFMVTPAQAAQYVEDFKNIKKGQI